MISFITNYDDATICNYNVYVRCGITPTVSLLSNDATSNNLISELTQTSMNVFAMSHGNDDKLCDQQGNHTFTTNNLAMLINRVPFNVFAYACNTSKALGKTAAAHNIRWFGFTSEINPPETDELLQPVYNQIFNYIYNNFQNVSCNNSAAMFLEGLKVLCDNSRGILDSTVLSDGNRPGISAYVSVKQMWEKQKIWLSQNNHVIHPNAPPPILW